jgi:hypothetical protein
LPPLRLNMSVIRRNPCAVLVDVILWAPNATGLPRTAYHLAAPIISTLVDVIGSPYVSTPVTTYPLEANLSSAYAARSDIVVVQRHVINEPGRFLVHYGPSAALLALSVDLPQCSGGPVGVPPGKDPPDRSADNARYALDISVVEIARPVVPWWRFFFAFVGSVLLMGVYVWG